MALNSLGLGFVFTAKNLASGTIRRLQGQLRGLDGQVDKSGRAMRAGFGVAAAGIAPLVAGVGGLAVSLNLADAAANFEQGVRRVANISGATGEELAKLRDAAIEAGLRTQFSPDEAVEGLSSLASLGFNAAESMGLLNDSLAFAAGGQIGIEEASRAAGAAVRVFSLQGDEMRTVADKLLKITNLTALQAGDMALALGTVSRGAGMTKQSLDEMLISMGLVRNAGLDVSVAASSVSSGLEFAAKNAKDFEAIGVDVFDKVTGKFRPFLDIVQDTIPALDKLSDAERIPKITDMFGRFGKTSFVNISAQLKQLVDKGLPGIQSIGDAVEFLRAQMRGAVGTAEEFSENLLDTFAGQKKILEGAAQTLTVVLGEGFARVFKPIVALIAQVTSTLARLWDSLPRGLQTGIAAFVVFASVASIATGVLLIFSGLAVVIAPIFAAVLKVFLLVTAALLPLVAGFAALGGAIALVAFTAKRNFGGLGDWFRKKFDQIKLVWEGLTQLFSTGTFSGAVFEEMQKAENSGIRRFVIGVAMVGHRVMRFFKGFRAAFGAAMERLGPAFEKLMLAFGRLGQVLGFVSTQSSDALAGTKTDKWVEMGAKVATGIANALEVVVNVMTSIVQGVTNFVKSLRSGLEFISPVFEGVGAVFKDVGDQLGDLFRKLGFATGRGEEDALSFGDVIGKVFTGLAAVAAFQIGIVLGAIDLFLRSANFLVSTWQKVSLAFEGISIRIKTAFLNVVDGIASAIDKVIGFMARVASKVPARFRGPALEGLIQAGAGSERRIAERRQAIVERNRSANAAVADIEARLRAQGEDESRRGGADRQLVADTVAELSRQRREEKKEALNVQLYMDGEQVGRIVDGARRREGARGFVPVPAAVE